MAETPPENDAPLPPDLRLLKGLVVVLTAVMILGVLTIVVLLVMRLNAETAPVLVHPDRFDLPPGVAATGYHLYGQHTLIVADDGVLRIFETESGEMVDSHTLPD